MTQQKQEFQLSLTDISDAAKIIKASIERSTFKAEEMLGVATVYERIMAFLHQEQLREEALATATTEIQDSEGA